MTVHLLSGTFVDLDASNSALDGVENLIIECLFLDVMGEEVDLRDVDGNGGAVYLTSGSYPYMIVNGLDPAAGFDAAEKHKDGDIYGGGFLRGCEGEFTETSLEDFPMDGAVPLELA